MAIPKELWVAYTRIFFVEIAYWTISIGMVFVNENVLSANLLTDDLTVFITIFQILFSLAILLTLNHITNTNQDYTTNHSTKNYDGCSEATNTRLIDNDELELESTTEDNLNLKKTQLRKASTTSNDLLESLTVKLPSRINFETCKVVFPLSILYIGMLLTNNFCLKNVGVAFYFVSRSLTTVFNVIFTRFIINEPISQGALICCFLIIFGFVLGIDQEGLIGDLSVIGVMFGVASSLFTSLFTIFTKKTLAKLDKNIWILVLYNNINAIAICTPLLILHGDLQSLISDKVVNASFWLLLSISGVMSFFISIVTNASIKFTSPLTHNISGTAKACFQTTIAVIYLHDHKPLLWWISNLLILVASASYSRIKQQEMEQRATNLSQGCPGFTESKSSTLTRSLRRASNSSGDGGVETPDDPEDRNSCSVKFNTSGSAPA